MFVELFHSICNNVVEWLVGLGLSTATIYSIVRFVKFIIYLFTKKKRIAQKQAENDALAELITNKVIAKLEPYFANTTKSSEEVKAEIKTLAQEVQNNESETIKTLAIDTSAYQTVMLSQDESLRLSFETIRSELVNASIKAKDVVKDVSETTATVAENLTEAIETNEENIMKATEKVAKTAKKVKTTAKKIKKKAQVVYSE